MVRDTTKDPCVTVYKDRTGRLRMGLGEEGSETGNYPRQEVEELDWERRRSWERGRVEKYF